MNKMTKNTAIATILTLASASSMAATVTVGASQATQDLSIGLATASTTDTGLMAEWYSDDLFGMEMLQQGLSFNGATKEGNVISYYLRPNAQLGGGVELFAKLGVSITGATTTAASVKSTVEPSAAFGAGLVYHINKEYSVTAQYDQLYSDDVWDMTAVSIGVGYTY